MTSTPSAWTTTSRRGLWLAACLLASSTLAAPPASAQASAPSRTVRVSGDAEILVTPDEAVLRLGVETLNEDLETAVAENARAVAAVQAVARRAGVPDTRIAMDYLGLQPMTRSRTRDGYTETELYGYRVRRAVTVTLRDLGAFDALLRDAVAAGANTIHSVDFQTTEMRRYRDQARAEAVQAALDKAAALSSGLGQTLGAPISISERGQGWSVGSAWGGFGAGAMQNVSVSAGAPSAAAPGQISVRAGVDVTFALAD